MKRLTLIAVMCVVILANGCVVYPTPYGPGVSLGVAVAPVYGPYYYGGYYGRYYGGYYHRRW